MRTLLSTQDASSLRLRVGVRTLALLGLGVYLNVLGWMRLFIEATGGLVHRVALVGMLALCVLAVIREGKVRKPPLALGFVFSFLLWGTLSWFWTADQSATIQYVRMSVTAAPTIYFLWNFAPRPSQWRWLVASHALGLWVATLVSLWTGAFVARAAEATRIVAEGFNANELAILVALGIPFAWYLFVVSRSWLVRALMLATVLSGPMAAIQTGSRGGFAVLVTCLLAVVLVRPRAAGKGPMRPTRRWMVAPALVLVAVGIGAAKLVADAPKERILTIENELVEGDLGGRADVWQMGLEIIPRHPVVGTGAASFYERIRRMAGSRGRASHNVMLSVVAEQGIIGLALFLLLLGAVFTTVWRGAPGPERTTLLVVLLAWLVAGLSADLVANRQSWILIGLVICISRGDQVAGSRASTPQP